MICYNHDLLYLHIPKCAGHSVTKYLQQTVPGMTNKGLMHRHVPLRTFPSYTGIVPTQFNLILATIRNPYDREVSQWAYYRQEFAKGKSSEEFIIAATTPFKEWVKHPTANFGIGEDTGEGIYHWWFSFCGQILPQTKLIKVEEIEEIHEVTKPYRIMDGEIARLNTSKHDPYQNYYDEATRKIVRDKHAWVFEQGYYSEAM